MLAREIIASLVVFEKVKDKVQDFDLNRFEAELKEYFVNHNLIE
jgi:hypothetical protein